MLLNNDIYGPMPQGLNPAVATPPFQLPQMPSQQGFASLDDFLKSPQALALAAGLLSQAGPSRTPVSLGAGLGAGLQGMQQAGQQGLDNRFKLADYGMRQQDFQGKQEDRKFNRQIGMSRLDIAKQDLLIKQQQFGLQMQQMNDFHNMLFSGEAPSQNNAPPSVSSIPMSNISGPNITGPYDALPTSNNASSSNIVGPYNTFPNNNAQGMPSNITGAFNPVPTNTLAPSSSSQAPAQNIGAQATSMFSNLDPQIRMQAGILGMKGDYKGAFDLINKAREQYSYTPDGFAKNPMMGPSRGGQGGTYINPQTGQAISSDTSAQTSSDQLAISGADRVLPHIAKLAQIAPQFQRADVRAASALQGIANQYFHSNYPLPSQQALKQQLINDSLEGIMKTNQWINTNESMDAARTIITPQSGESPEGYKTRVLEELNDLKTSRQQAQQRLAHGIVLNQNAQSPQQAGYSRPQLEAYAQDAIAKGADPQAVQQRLAQMQRGM